MARHAWTRRGFLSSLAASAAIGAPVRAQVFPPERVRYADPLTEFPVLRLTSPAHSSFLPAAHHRWSARKRSFLIYASDRTGSLQLFQMVLSTGESRRLTEAAQLEPGDFTLSADDRSVFYFDNGSLRELTLASLREREIYRVREGWARAHGFTLSGDGTAAVLAEVRGEQSQLRLLRISRREPVVASDVGSPAVLIRDPLLRPKHTDILFREGPDALSVSGYDGGGRRALPLAPGGLGQGLWSPDGESVLYLNLPRSTVGLNAIREYVPASGAERLVSSTSQFATFAPNGDASVFVGASGSKASPCVLLLLRVTRRELTLCEHRASDAVSVAPRFTPDSQFVFFQSDRHGKPAIYALRVERMVEKTGDE